MLAVQKWAEDKPFFLKLLAPQLAAGARDIHMGFRHIRERRILNHQFPLPHLSSWFALYRSHRKPLNFIKPLFSEFSVFGKESIDFGEAAIEGLRMISNGMSITPDHPPTSEEVGQAKNILENLLSESFLDIKDDFDNTPYGPDIKDNFIKLLSERELESSFFCLVSTPCWLLYRISPTRLYRKARLGDLEALEKLLRLDPLMLHDPAIGKQIQAFRFKNKNNSYQTLLEAPLKRPKAKITRKKIKYTTAGLISAIATTIKFPLTEPDIRALFDAVAKDAEGKLIDSDLADSPESFYTAIWRERGFWLQMLNPDTKK